MNKSRLYFTAALLLWCSVHTAAQPVNVSSPDSHITVTVSCDDQLSYSVTRDGQTLVFPSRLGFEFKNEQPMGRNLQMTGRPDVEEKTDRWQPVVAGKHAQVSMTWREATIHLQETTGLRRKLDFQVRVFNDGVAFRYQLFRGREAGDRLITRETTQFSLPLEASAWVTQQNGGWHGDQEAEFVKMPVSDIQLDHYAGLPLLVEESPDCYLAITEAYLDNYPGFYVGAAPEQANDQTVALTTRLAPLPGEPEDGIKERFSTSQWTPWRVILIGQSAGQLIESEIVKTLNPPCAISDTGWIKPGLSAWDHWWSGEVKMEMPVIKQYIDMAAVQGWPYMLVDWQWYGKYDSPEADITRPAPQIDMPELIRYAAERNVRLWLWLYYTDVNANSAMDRAFALYEQWGIAGVKIDFMNRNDQEMVRWYRQICQKAAAHHLMVDFHGAYRPDGIERTWPNLLTREGVLGEEYSKFSDRIVPTHNVTLPFTRMLAGPMDYTPGGFLNVTKAVFRKQSPTLVMNTRAAELSKFVIYESPLTVVSDHPDHILGQPGAYFLKIVPTTWDDTRFLSGYPGEHIALARQKGHQWFIGAMNNEEARTITIDTKFLPAGTYTVEYWADGRHADTKPTQLEHRQMTLEAGQPLRVRMASGGGYVAVIGNFRPLVSTVHRDSIRLSDPCILPDKKTRTYYMTGTGGLLWKSKDLEMWTGPYKVEEHDPKSWMGANPMIWAAELHQYKGKYYYFATFTNRDIKIDTVRGNVIERRASHVLVSNRPDGPYRPMDKQIYLPADRPTLDGTFWVDTDGKPYMVYCGEWLQNWNGTIEKIQLEPDLSGTIGEGKVLFRANDCPWSREKEDGVIKPNKVTDGPWLFRTDTGRLGMLWTSWVYDAYTQGVAYSESGTLDGPWIQEADPITPPNYGHGMLFQTFEGKWMISLHSHKNVNGRYIRIPCLFEVDLSDDKLLLKVK